MKIKLLSAKLPLPKFRSDEEAAAYFETHSVADVWDQLPSAGQVRLSKALEKSIRERQRSGKIAHLDSPGS